MTKGQRTWIVVAVVALAVGLWWVLFIALPRWTAPKPATPPPPRVRTEPTPRIRARLYHLSDDGLRLQPVESEVPFGEGTLEQGRQLTAALLRPPSEPFVSVIPAGTTLKGFYLSPEGVAFVDLGAEAGRAHVGALDEIFIVYSIVNTLTDNLPAITAVQLLVDGRQVDTLAGHVDVRRPVIKDLRWTELPQGGEPPTAAAVAQGGNPPPR
jgi:Sporulation and spore germination